MLKIEITSKGKIRINGIVSDKSRLIVDENGHKFARISHPVHVDLMFEQSFLNLKAIAHQVLFRIEKMLFAKFDFEFDIYVGYEDFEIFKVKIGVVPHNRDSWKEPFSIMEFFTMLRATARTTDLNITALYNLDNTLDNSFFNVTSEIADPNTSIGSYFNPIIDELCELILSTEQQLRLTNSDGEIIQSFKFPDSIKTACKQYLIYFGQFLADMGIEAETGIREELDKTLFSILPKAKNESLEKIRDALNIYLQAPGNPEFEVQMTMQNDVASLQWSANVMHLKSQLLLAKGLIQTKDATIEALTLTNYQYKQMLESSEKKQSGEDVIPGIVAVKKYEGKGFSVDLPEIFRRLKRKLGK